MITAITAEQKIIEINNELRIAGLWEKKIPAWVTDYEEKRISTEQDFLEWLQFIYLPNCTRGQLGETKHIVPQAIKFFGDDVRKGKLLQLLIELDALL